MKQKSILSQFIRGFVKALLIIVVLGVVGVGSYQLTMLYYRSVEHYSPEKAGTQAQDLVADAAADPIAQNLIYCVNEETNEIENIVLEIFNTYTSELDYITIPIDAKIAISNTMYQKLSKLKYDVPQIITLSKITKYFEGDSKYAYGTLVLEDVMEVDISFYSVIPSSVYETMFETSEAGVQQLTQAYQKEMSENTEEKVVKEYITSLYDKIESNLSLQKRLTYAKEYVKIQKEQIQYDILAITQNGTGNELDVTAANEKLASVLSAGEVSDASDANETVDSENTDTPNNESGDESVDEETLTSKNANIQILNGSNITGLAGYYNQKLTASGYTIANVGNYTQGTLTTTKIIVKEEALGQDLKQFFNNAVIEIGTLESDVDIQIILGTADQIS